MIANPARGEATIAGRRLRPSFAALVAAEEELGPLFALVERGAAGTLGLGEMTTLFWHCLDPQDIDRAVFGEAVVRGGLAQATPTLRVLLTQILKGGG